MLRRGGLGAFPTETVYGLGAHALDPAAVRRVFEAKGRPSFDPLIVHLSESAGLDDVAASVPPLARELAARFWPGPLTLVLPKQPRVPPEVTAGLDTVAVRVPAHPVARALLRAAAIPIAAPSANQFSRPSPTLAAHVVDDLGGRIDIVLDAGPTPVGVESTVLDLTTDPPAILRPGGITWEPLCQSVPNVVIAEGSSRPHQPVPSPGMLDVHYAPRTPLWLFEGPPSRAMAALRSAAEERLARGERVAVVVNDDDASAVSALPAILRTLGDSRDSAAVASGLFAALRSRDREAVGVILVGLRQADGLGRAVRDRLRRAAADRIVRAD